METLARDGVLREGDRVVVALSGGMDSLVLLHLLRFTPDLFALDLSAAHFDHRMREESGADAAWVRGLCRSWGVSCHLGRATEPPTTEDGAREARYGFLHGVMEEVGGTRLLTAHQGDDQAETVLFRILRGTGLRGLAGIPRQRWPRLYRPLLSFPRAEISAYGEVVGIRPREDPSNRKVEIARNALRHRILPAVEKGIAPGARSSLRRLARLARENEEAWSSLMPGLLEGTVQEEEGGFSFVRSAFLAYHPAVRARLLRDLFRRVGIGPGEAGTRAALEFTRTGASGGAVNLPGGFRLSREFDRLVLSPGPQHAEDVLLEIPDASAGEGEAVIGGRRVAFRWGGELGHGVRSVFRGITASLAFPLRVRGWCPGDRIRFAYGRKKLKKLFAEARIPVSERKRIAVLADGKGRVLWVEAPPTLTPGAGSSDDIDFLLGIMDGHQS